MRIGRTRLIIGLSFGLFPWTLSVHAQQSTKVPRVAILSDEGPSLGATTLEPFAQALRDLGYTEGQNIAFERRYASEKNDILPNLAAELVSLQPDVILAIGTLAARAANSATQTIQSSLPESLIRLPLVSSRLSPGRAGTSPALACNF